MINRSPLIGLKKDAIDFIIAAQNETGFSIQVRHVKGHIPGAIDGRHMINKRCDIAARREMRKIRLINGAKS